MIDLQYVDREGNTVSMKDKFSSSDFWTIKGRTIMKHMAIERLAYDAGVEVTSVKMLVAPSDDNMQQHGICIKVKHTQTGRTAVNVGEASRLNTGKYVKGKYVEEGRIDCQYRLSMAYKRGYDRAVLDVLGLLEIYSDIESAEFQNQSADVTPPENFNY